MKLSLNKTWTECIRMWKWIDTHCKKTKLKLSEITVYKNAWLLKNPKYINELRNDCFFCEYARIHNYLYATSEISKICEYCPATKVDRTFFCTLPNISYNHYPHRFYKLLVKLNKQRLNINAKHKKSNK